MTTFRMPILGGPTLTLDVGVPPDTIGNQITEATAPSIGTIGCYVMADGGADEGIYVAFKVPKNYVGTPKMVVTGVLDGAPGAADILGFGMRKRAVANNGAADGTFDAEEIASATIGSNSLAYSDEDLLEISITLTAGQYAVDNQVFCYVYIDASATTYAGNFLLTELEFEYTDV